VPNCTDEERFSRTLQLLGPDAFQRLRRARVLVVGLGAVGSYAVEGLARAGVGFLRLVDFDVVQISNINRQLYALESTLGRPKVEVAAQRVQEIHPSCQVDARQLFVDAATAPELFEGGLDAVVDAMDSLGPKVAFLAAAVRAGTWVVSSMGAALRTDPFAIRVGDLSETRGCPLARWVRRRLRKLGIERGIRCVYSIEPVPRVWRCVAADHSRDTDEYRRGRPRGALGSLSTLTGIFGLVAATEVLRHLAGPCAATTTVSDLR